ncbi:hypothetical protein NQD34_011024 [Periophthalmus magnuspinnatus]|nr:hypothetical protein NQD34_011024 [Periophthalmus magnuspinnatus]
MLCSPSIDSKGEFAGDHMATTEVRKDSHVSETLHLTFRYFQKPRSQHQNLSQRSELSQRRGQSMNKDQTRHSILVYSKKEKTKHKEEADFTIIGKTSSN